MLDRRFFFLAVITRIIVYIFLHDSMGIAASSDGILSRHHPDTTYFDSIENLITYNHYTTDVHFLPAYASRMPGYGIVYGFFRLFLSKIWACDAIVLLQIILSLISLNYLGKLTYILTRRVLIAYGVVFIHSVSPYGAQPDFFLLTESFAASSMIIGSYYFSIGLSGHNQKLFVSGCWLTWIIFLRPYMAPLLIIWPVIYLFHHSYKFKKNLRIIGIGLVWLLMPFILIDGTWTVRNALVLQQFLPLQVPYAAIEFPTYFLEARRFAAALGEDPVEWNTSSLMPWLMGDAVSPQASPKQWHLTNKYNYDSLIWVRQQIQLARTEESLPLMQQHKSKKAVDALRRFHDNLVEEKPFIYYIVAPLRLTYHLVLTGGGNSIFAQPFSDLTLWQRVIRLFFTFSHWVLMAASLFSYLTWPRRVSAYVLLIRLPAICLILLFVICLRYVESRYFIVVYPLALISGFVWLVDTVKTIKTRLRLEDKAGD